MSQYPIHQGYVSTAGVAPEDNAAPSRLQAECVSVKTISELSFEKVGRVSDGISMMGDFIWAQQ